MRQQPVRIRAFSKASVSVFGGQVFTGGQTPPMRWQEYRLQLLVMVSFYIITFTLFVPILTIAVQPLGKPVESVSVSLSAAVVFATSVPSMV